LVKRCGGPTPWPSCLPSYIGRYLTQGWSSAARKQVPCVKSLPFWPHLLPSSAPPKTSVSSVWFFGPQDSPFFLPQFRLALYQISVYKLRNDGPSGNCPGISSLWLNALGALLFPSSSVLLLILVYILWRKGVCGAVEASPFLPGNRLKILFPTFRGELSSLFRTFRRIGTTSWSTTFLPPPSLAGGGGLREGITVSRLDPTFSLYFGLVPGFFSLFFFKPREALLVSSFGRRSPPRPCPTSGTPRPPFA